MTRARAAAFALLLVSCGASSPPQAPTAPVPPDGQPLPPPFGPAQPGSPEGAPAPEPTTSLSGTVYARPFVGRAALLTREIHWTNGRVTTTIHVFERPRSCDAVSKLYPLSEGERAVEVRFGTVWPVARGSVWTAGTTEDEFSRADSVGLAFKHGSTGVLAEGRVEVLESSAAGGTLKIDAVEGRLSVNYKGRSDNSVNGEISFEVCPGAR